ncbi:MAG TPA: hypothetical protein VK400_04665 [Pyrinomonadaceae bacterium]|nr:hypothetical protein [Pyrinomonadaceae bacterium]
MKKLLATFMLMACVLVFAGTTAASIYDPGTNRCHDADGKFVAGPNCDPNSCGCLFHEIFDYIKEMF